MVQPEINRREKIIFEMPRKKLAKDFFVNNISQKATAGRNHLNFIRKIMKSVQSIPYITGPPSFPLSSNLMFAR